MSQEEMPLFQEEDLFAEEKLEVFSQPPWRMLIVDDEAEVHHITRFVLKDFNFQGKSLEFLSAYSAQQAKNLLKLNNDIAVILLDVVMETTDAGLQLVHYIREDLKNHFVRIILRTGQPGYAPEKGVVRDYDINDYKNKTELTEEKLYTSLITSLRNYEHLVTIEEYRKTLEDKVNERTGELQQKNQELLEINHILGELNQEKNEFLHIAAHDLKNPLSAIQGLAEMIYREHQSLPIEKMSHFANTIALAAKEMFGLIKRLLDVNAVESGKMRFSAEAFDLAGILQFLISSYSYRAQEKEIMLIYKPLVASLPIYADKNAVIEILENLLSNAIKYSPKGKTVTLSLEIISQAVHCRIQDEGPGLSWEDQNQLFSKFSRLTPRPTGNESSTGLGLFIVKKLATAMRGKVWCESELGKGTCFVVEFPLSDGEVESESETEVIQLDSPQNSAMALQQSFKAMREMESRLVQFLEAMPVGVGVVDKQGKLYYLNRLAQKLLNKNLSEEATINKIPELCSLYYAGTEQIYEAEYLPITRALMGESATIDDIEIHRDDLTIPLEVWGAPIFDDRGDIAYAITVFQDITKRKKSEFEREKFTRELFQLKKAYERFVPREFLNLLDKPNVIEVQLGDHVEKEMTVLFSDIRGFTSLSEHMDPQEMFDFINNYLGQMEPIILKHHGFIDKYIGDAIMALFPTNVDEAVRGGIAMMTTLHQYNELLQRAGYSSIQIGIGLNTGPLILGTVGGQNRMDGTVISDAVNVAARIEELTKIYGTHLLITEQTYLKLKFVMQYHIRVIDRVKVKGKTKVITVYEVFDADPDPMLELKLNTLRDFEQGFMCYHNNNFEKAQMYFERVFKANQQDKAAQVYLERCQINNRPSQ